MLEQILEKYEDAGFFKPDGLDEAIIGVDEKGMVLIYSYKKCIDLLIKNDNMSEEDAMEHIEYNVIGSCVGMLKSPIFCFDLFKQPPTMKLFYFNPNSYGAEYFVMAPDKIHAHKALLTHFLKMIEKQTTYKDETIREHEIWKKVNPVDPSTFPQKYTLDEHESSHVIETELA